MADEILLWGLAEPESFKVFKETTHEDDLINYHTSLGRDIRNHFELWSYPHMPIMENGIDISPDHPDAISGLVIREAWTRLQ